MILKPLGLLSIFVRTNLPTATGLLLVTKGQEMTPSLRGHLKSFDETMKVRQPIKVLVPLAG